MDQLIRGPGFMPPPQARPPMALNLTDHSPNSSNKVRKQIDYYRRISQLGILLESYTGILCVLGTLTMLHRRVTRMKIARLRSLDSVDHLSWHPA
ncbi:hypothetical protein Sjap_026427 [Stephania japonica]|uniref:Uncharacterized protein n=1 Tax=Stephania japonica TaxID=461633 RepID=A0AAP0E3P4_9MAGN